MATRAELLRARRATRPARQRVRVQQYPAGLERQYERTLLGLVDELTRAVSASFERALSSGRIDARVTLPDVEMDATRGERAREAIRGVQVDFSTRLTDLKARTLARGIGRDVATHAAGEVDKQIEAATQGLVPVNVLATRQQGVTQAAVEAWARENVALIKTVPSRYFDQIEAVVVDSVAKGRRASAVAKLIEERGEVAGFNARRIARDQVGKLNGKITEARQTALGVRRYVWRTSRDERVRSEHQALEGEIFDWDNPPDVGHPGEDIQCRCRAEPVIDDILEGL